MKGSTAVVLLFILLCGLLYFSNIVPANGYILTIAISGSGSTVPPAGRHTYANGTQISVVATANSGCAFLGWTLDGVQNSSNPMLLVMSSGHILNAIFTGSQFDLGLSVCITSSGTSTDETILHSIMSNNNIKLVRYSISAPEWDGYTWDPAVVQWFLDNTQYTIIVDRNHIYPAGASGDSDAVAHWTQLTNNLLDICSKWNNNPRVWVELVNEYQGSDFNTRVQGLIDTIRTAGYGNTLVIDGYYPFEAYHKFNDPLDSTYQGQHYYFDANPYWTPAAAINDLKGALNLGITKIVNTEVGASGNEYQSFTSTNVGYLSTFLADCEALGIDNCVWQGVNVQNWQTYVNLGLMLPNRGSAK